MKKIILAATILACAGVVASAQPVEQPKFGDNWNLGIEAGVTTPMNHNAFFGAMRPIMGIHFGKQISPVIGLGIEGNAAINTSNWYGHIHSSNAFDQVYAGVYGTADLFNLFGGYNCKVRPFTIAANIGAGWGHDFFAWGTDKGSEWNYFATKAGLDFNFNVSNHCTIAIKPFVTWNMGGDYSHSDVAYNRSKAAFNIMAGFNYRFGKGFQCVKAYDQAEVDGLNAQINALRADLDACTAANAATLAQNADLAAQLAACQAKPAEVVKEVKEVNTLNSVRFVFFRVGSSKITADQQPNVEMIAAFMKNHPKSKVVIKGYASPEGNYDFNVKLANNRAQAVKDALVNKYKIAADRITAEGEGIGKMFEEESWNRVSICTLEEE